MDALLRDGYVVVPCALSDTTWSDATRDVEVFKARNRSVASRASDPAGRLSRVVNLHLAVPSLASVFSDNDALAVCDAFFEAETALYTSLYFERGSEQDLHRDSPLFVTRPAGRYLGVWAALEDIDRDNGPLMVVPGSHALPELDVEAMATELYGDASEAPAISDIGWETYQSAVRAQTLERSLEAVEVHVSRGDVIIWHPSLFHGGAPHRTDARTRRSLVMHVTPVGVPVYHQDVFFDPGKHVSDLPVWTYYEHHGRRIARLIEIDFAHEFQARVATLQRPDARWPERLRAYAVASAYRLLRR